MARCSRRACWAADYGSRPGNGDRRDGAREDDGVTDRHDDECVARNPDFGFGASGGLASFFRNPSWPSKSLCEAENDAAVSREAADVAAAGRQHDAALEMTLRQFEPVDARVA